MDVKTRLINYYNSNLFIQKYVKGLNNDTNEVLLSYNGNSKKISMDELEKINNESEVLLFLEGIKEEPVIEPPVSMVEPKVISNELDRETLNDIKILTEIKNKTGIDNLLKDFAVNESTGLIDINKAINIVEENTINEVIKSIKEKYSFDLNLENYDKKGIYIGKHVQDDTSDDEKIVSSFNNLKVYLEATSMFPDQVELSDEDINRKMKEYIDKVKLLLNPKKEEPKPVVTAISENNKVLVNQSAGFADIFVLCMIIVVYLVIIVNLILKLV